MKTIALILAAFLAGTLLSLTHTATARDFGKGDRITTQNGPFVAYWMVRPCGDEDDVNCIWNARARGNHKGRTFIVRRVPGKAGMICVFYVDRKYARNHDYCS